MHELMGQRVWALAPSAIEQVCALVRQSLAGAVPFPRREAESRPQYALSRGVAVIDVRGTLSKRGGWWTTGYEQIRTAMEAALADPAARSILLNVDSPGGAADGVKVLADWIASVRGVKPLCAYADGTALSAAYWLAAATGRVVAPRTAEVGSVGVVMQHLDWSRANERSGVAVTYVHSGRWKVAGNPDSPLSDEDQAYLQEQCDTLYALFTEDVSRHMGLDPAAAAQWADGQVFFADRALELGLVSAVTPGREELIEQLSKEASPMNRQELEDRHPEILTEVQAEARTSGEAEGRKAALAEAGAIVRAVAGDETAERFQALAGAGVTAAQLEALAPLLAAQGPEAPAGDADAASRERILSALQAGSPAPVHHAGQPRPETPETKRAASAQRMKDIPRR
ncbi:S49 family peptidase [Desulfocurvus sp. DL9XJH121]